MGQRIDFTTMRKGTVCSRTRDGSASEKIGVCPKCGRKGSIRQAWQDKSGIWYPMEVTHVGTIELGMFLHVDDHCTIYDPAQQEHNKTVRAERAAKRAALASAAADTKEEA